MEELKIVGFVLTIILFSILIIGLLSMLINNFRLWLQSRKKRKTGAQTNMFQNYIDLTNKAKDIIVNAPDLTPEQKLKILEEIRKEEEK